MQKQFDSFYFLHVPKTAGRFFTHNIVVPLDNIFKENNIENFYDRDTYVAHRFWGNFIKDTTYVTSLLRDPIKHAVSFYCHYSMLDKGAQRTIPVGAFQYNKNTMFDWMDQYAEFAKNMQSKNFLLSDLGEKKGILNSDKAKNCIVSKEIILNKLKLVPLLIRSEDLVRENVEKIFNKILTDFEIPNKKLSHKIQKASNYWNPDSTRIYNSLTESDKNKILEWNNIDAEIYNTDNLFYSLKERPWTCGTLRIYQN